MSTIYFIAGLLTGILLGVGASIFYLRWKVRNQLMGMQNQMESMMEMTEDMGLAEIEEEGKEQEGKDEDN